MRKRKSKNNYSVSAIEARAKSFLPEKKHGSEVGRCFVVDGMNIAYMAYYAYRSLRFKGRATSIIFGFPMILKGIMTMYKADKVVVCWDGEKHPRRLELLPTYKSHRENTKERQDVAKRKDFYKQIDRLRKLLFYLGIPQVHNPKMEGDDAVYWVSKRLQNLYKVWIISGDKDFCQLINYDVSVFNPRTKSTVSTFAFLVDMNVEVHQYVDYLCLVGDESDDIPGYRGIGPVRAAKFLKQFGSIRAYIKNKKADFPGIYDKDALKKLWRKNRELIGLKRFNEEHHTDKDVTYYRGRTMPEYNEVKYAEFCARFNLKTFMFESFKQPFLKLQDNA